MTPRKGQTAYDRRDNLVLACKRCNTAKADKPFLMYLLGQRARAENLARFGQHLSDGILDIVRPMVGDVAPQPNTTELRRQRLVYGSDGIDDSPYSDSPYRATA